MLTTFTGATDEALAAIAEEKRIRKTASLVLLFDMGSQFSHLIFQKVAKRGVFCLVADPAKVTVQDVRAVNPKGIIVSGGPASMHNEPPPFDMRIFDELQIPTLGICLGFQMWAKAMGADVCRADRGEYCVETFTQNMNGDSVLLDGIGRTSVLQSHGDMVERGNSFMQLLGSTGNCEFAAARQNHLYGVQFHPECSETVLGERIFENFLGGICGIRDRFPATDAAETKVDLLRKQIKDKTVLLALSGGSDSSVVAHLLKRAAFGTKTKLFGIYIKGVDRPDDEANVVRYFGGQPWIQLKVVDATEDFLAALKGVTSAKEKRVAMRSVYKKILEEKIAEHGADYIAQGTLYTDLVESGHGHSTGARRAQIKLHHNTNLQFSIPELTPLDDCVKDNARDIGRRVGTPEELLTRQPFPGPGMLVRIEGEVTEEKLALARGADAIMTEELTRSGHFEKIWQSGLRVTISEHTKSAGDDAGVGAVLVWFAVSSVNGFTARPYPVPDEVRFKIADRIGNELRGVGAVCYRDSGKPYSTIEAE